MSKGIITQIQRQDQVISRLKNENAKLRAKLKERDVYIAQLEEKLERALLHIEELQKYVFRGKKKGKDKDDGKDNDNKPSGQTGDAKKRSQDSYRRPAPDESVINDVKRYDIKHCPDCGTKLAKIKLLEFFEEDIIPIVEWFGKLKKVSKLIITTGYCPGCQKRVSAIPIPKQKASIGKNIRQLIVFQTTVLQLSQSQVIDLLESHLHFKISSGEIAHILSAEALKLKPAFEDLLKGLRDGLGVHMDETGYNIAFHDEYSGNFCWVMTSIDKDNPDAVFMFGKNRGKGNAIKLLGEDYEGYGVTDDYPGYRNTFKAGKHALCWAHPKRKFKDLKNSNGLTEKKREACQEFYGRFTSIYERVSKEKQADRGETEKEAAKAVLKSELEDISEPGKNDPTKLKTLKKTLLEKIDRYFVCLTEPKVPMDNNKAERALRHLVIKRKKSFGSKTPKGAEMMSTIYSVVMSLWWRSKEEFFKAYNEALSV
jgi:transposase